LEVRRGKRRRSFPPPTLLFPVTLSPALFSDERSGAALEPALSRRRAGLDDARADAFRLQLEEVQRASEEREFGPTSRRPLMDRLVAEDALPPREALPSG